MKVESEFNVRDMITESEAKDELLCIANNLKETLNKYQELLHSNRIKNMNRYVAEGYPFNDSVDWLDVVSWCDHISEKLSSEKAILKNLEGQYDEIKSAFNRFRLHFTNAGVFDKSMKIPSYKGCPAIVFHNSYIYQPWREAEEYNVIAYIKDGALEVDYENGESFYDHPLFKEGCPFENIASFIKYGMEVTATEGKEI